MGSLYRHMLHTPGALGESDRVGDVCSPGVISPTPLSRSCFSPLHRAPARPRLSTVTALALLVPWGKI